MEEFEYLYLFDTLAISHVPMSNEMLDSIMINKGGMHRWQIPTM